MGLLWNKLKKDKLTVLCLAFIAVVILAGIFAPFIAANDPVEVSIKDKLQNPSAQYILGTDYLGRCVFSRLVYGIRTTVFLSLGIMVLTITVGMVLGIVAAYFRGRIDEAVMRICDVMLSFPSEVMLLAVVGILGPSIFNIVIGSILIKWAWYTRMIREVTLKYVEKDYVRFAKVAGGNFRHTLKTHLLPSCAAEIIVLATLDTSSIILTISALSFLGLGVQAPTPEWGAMLSEAKNIMAIRPLQMLPAGIAITLVVVAFNYLGDSIRNALDPKYSKQ